MCIAGRMRAARNQRGEAAKLRASVSHPRFAKKQQKIITIL